MSNLALLDAAGIVTNIIIADPDFELPGATLVPAEGAHIGWHWDGEGFAPPAPEPVELETLRAQMSAAVRARRWEVETGGCVVNGVPIRTDEQSQAKIDAAAALLDKDPEMVSIDFEAQPDVWVTLDRDAMTAIGIAAGRHVQAAFSRARVLSELSGTRYDVDEVGVLYAPIPEGAAEDDTPEARDGWHVNVLWWGEDGVVPDFGADEITPATPSRVFAPPG